MTFYETMVKTSSGGPLCPDGQPHKEAWPSCPWDANSKLEDAPRGSSVGLRNGRAEPPNTPLLCPQLLALGQSRTEPWHCQH